MNITKTIKRLIRSAIPTRRLTFANPRFEFQTLAPTMDADRIHQVLDSAQAGDTRELFALYRDIILMDSHIQAEFAKRKLAVLGDQLSILPADQEAPNDVAAATAFRAAFIACPGYINALAFLLDATLWPVAVVEKVFSPAPGGHYRLSDLVPVPHQLLDFTTGHLRIRDLDPATQQPLSTTHPAEPGRYIVHRGHLISAPDNWGGPMRSIVFWWLLSTMSRDWWARFLDRYGSPFLLGRYEPDNPNARNILERAFSLAVKLGGLAVTKETEVEVVQVAAANTGEAYSHFLSICQREKSKLILGQTLSAEAQPTGLGSGVASGQEAVRQDIRRFDAVLLGLTLRQQLAEQFLQINALSGATPTINWGSESAIESKSLADLIVSLYQAGLQIADPSLKLISERIGFQLERKPAIVSPFSISTLTADPADSIARGSSAHLAQAFRGSLAPIRRIIQDSRSSAECEARIREFYADWSPERLSALIAEALDTLSASGLTSLRSPRHPR